MAEESHGDAEEAGLSELAGPLDVLARRRLGGVRISDLARLTAGASQEIWRFSVVRDEGADTPVILRRAPGGVRVSESAIGHATVAGVISAAGAAGVPVPKILWVLEPDDGLGLGYVMSCVPGETLGGRIARGEASPTPAPCWPDSAARRWPAFTASTPPPSRPSSA